MAVLWAHGDPEWGAEEQEVWQKTVLGFTHLLRSCGIDADLDLFHGHTATDWARFGPTAIRESDYVLVAVSRAWRRAWEGDADAGKHAGALGEANTLRGVFVERPQDFLQRVIPVLLPGRNESELPTELRASSHWARVPTLDDQGTEDLLRRITGQPAFPKPPLGEPRRLPPRTPETSAPSVVSSASGDSLAEEASDSEKEIQRRIDLAESALGSMPGPSSGSGGEPWDQARESVEDRHEALQHELAQLKSQDPPVRHPSDEPGGRSAHDSTRRPPGPEAGVGSESSRPPPKPTSARRVIRTLIDHTRATVAELTWPVAVLAAVIISVAVVLAIIMLGSRDGVTSPTFTQVGVSPRSLAFGLDAKDRIWIADPTQPEAWWLDASGPTVRTGQVFLRETARPVGVAVDPVRKAVWVVDETNDLAWEVDIPSKKVTRQVQVGDAPQAVAVAGDIVWVANRGGSVSRINAVNGQLIEPAIAISGRLTGIAASRSAIWVIDSEGNVVWRIDRDAPAQPPQDYTSNAPRAIAAGHRAVWVASRTGTVSRIDRDDVAPIDIGDELCGIAVDESVVWASAPATDRVWRIDSSGDANKTESVEVEDAPCAIAAANGAAWVANRGDNSVSRLEP